jgi:hypothetical protein
MMHMVREKIVSVGELSNNGLFREKGGVGGHFDFVMHKLALRQHYLHQILPPLQLSPGAMSAILETLGALGEYRSRVGLSNKALIDLTAPSASATTDDGSLAWQARWNDREKQAFQLGEELIYKDTFDRVIRQNQANKQSPSEIFQCQELETVLKTLAPVTEKPAQSVENGADDQDDESDGMEVEVLNPRLLYSVVHIPKQIDDANHVQTIKRYQDLARRKISQSVVFLTEPPDQGDVMSMLHGLYQHDKDFKPITEGDQRTYNIATYSVEGSGELVTHPHVRVMSFRSAHYEKMISGFLRSLLPPDASTLNKDNFPESAMLVVHDAGKNFATDVQFTDVFKLAGGSRILNQKHLINIHISSRVLEDRKERQRIQGALSLRSLNQAHIWVKDDLSLAYYERKHYEGSNLSDGIGPVPLVHRDLAWTATRKTKKEIYGKQARVAPGGRTPGIGPEQAKALAAAQKDDDLEPVFHFAFPHTYHEDQLAGLSPHRVVGLTAMDANEAFACMILGVPYIGVCHTDKHKSNLNNRLASIVFQGFMTEGSHFYEPDIAEAQLFFVLKSPWRPGGVGRPHTLPPSSPAMPCIRPKQQCSTLCH